MAVEIPVIIDIDGAFADAAKRVESAMKPLQSAIDGNKLHADITIQNIESASDELKELNKYFKGLEDADWEKVGSKLDLSPYINQAILELRSLEQKLQEVQELRQLEGGQGDFSFAEEYKQINSQISSTINSIRAMQVAQEQLNSTMSDKGFRKHIENLTGSNKELEKMREYYSELEESTARFSDSINAIRGRMADLSAEWNNMTKAERNSERGRELTRQYMAEAKELHEEALTQEEIYRKEERRQKEQLKILENQRKENAILKSTEKTISNLEQKERILSDRLKKAEVGSSQYKKLKLELEGVRQELDRINGSSKKADISLLSLVKNSLRLVALHATGSFLRNVREVTAEFELQRVALGSIIQDTERAEGLFRQIKAAAIESPFEIKDLVSYTKQLSAYQIETDKLFDTTMKLADVSAGLGVDMGRLILAYGQVRATAVLRGQELRQFTEAGIPLVEKLAEKFTQLRGETVKTGEVFQLISERAVPFSMIAEIFDDMTSAGGMFYKMQEKQAKTLAGQWANLKDSLSIMYDEIGNTDSVHKAMEALISDARWMMRNWQLFAEAIKGAGGALVTYVALSKVAESRTKLLAWANTQATLTESAREKSIRKVITAIVGETAAEAAATKAKQLHTFATAKLSAANTLLGKTFWALTAAMASNPFGVLAVAIAGVIALYNSLSSKARDVNKDVDAANNAINQLNKTRDETGDLIKAYDELSKKQSLTVEESKKLKDVSSELARIFPKASEGIDATTNSLALNIEKLKEYNKETEEALKKSLLAQIRVDKKEVSKNEDEIDKLTRGINRGWSKNKSLGLLSPILFPISDKQMAEMNERLVELIQTNEKYRQSIQEMEDAINGVKRSTSGTTESLTSWQDKLIEFNSRVDEDGKNIRIMTDDQIKGYSKLDSALEDIAKQYKEEAQQVKILEAALKNKNGEEEKDIKLALARAVARKELSKEILDYYNSFFLTQKKSSGGGSSKTDPFVTRMKERIKFMEDFRKGYEDLSKYMESSKALENVSLIMEGRGRSVGLSIEEQNRAAEDMANWYRDMLKAVASKLKDKGVSGASISDILSVDTSKKTKYVQDLQALLQQLWEGLTDLRTNEVKKKLEESLKRLENEMKRSETARSFFQNILDITGDKDLATTMSISVYGDVGNEFKERIQKQLEQAFSTLNREKISDDIWEELTKAYTDQDFSTILKYVELFPEKWREMLKQMAEDDEKHAADLMNNFANLISKYGDTAQKIATIQAKAQVEIQKVRDALAESLKDTTLTPEQIKALKDRADEIIKALEATRDLDVFKQSDRYIDFFSEINLMTVEEAAQVRGELRKAFLMAFQAGAISADELRKNLRAVDEQFRKLSESTTLLGAYLTGGFDGANKKLQEYSDNVSVLAAKMQSGKELNKSEQAFATRMLSMFGGDETKNVKSYTALVEAFSNSGGLEAAGEAFGQMGEGMSAMAANGPGALAIVDAIMKAVHSTISSIQQIIDQLNEVRSEENKIGEWFKYVSDFDRYTYSGWEKLKSGDAIGATADAVSSWISIFTNIQRSKVKKINEDIKEQANILEDLEYSYSRLNTEIEKSFGSEYIYDFNKQLDILRAKAEAYQKQAELERSKGKSADEKIAQDYEKSAREIQDQIADMQTQLSEFFSGTDLSSAAEDFANSWIEAYKEFGSTTDAMSEKFNQMINNMINRSLAAKIMQEMLGPIFEQIDLLASDGLLSTEEIASIAALAQERIPLINDAMTNLMTSLSSAGLDLRTNTSGLKGISKNIATASEESILGLAAGINTQNFYMSYVPTISENVAQILAVMTGDASGTPRAATRGMNGAEEDVIPSVQQMVYDHLPNMDVNISEMLRLFRSVIATKNTSSSAYIAVK